VVAAHLDPFVYNSTRFMLGVLTLFPFVGRRLLALTWLELWGGALAGLLLFGASSVQQVGLGFTTAGKAGLINGLYVVLVPLFLALAWRRWQRWFVWVASLLAAVGLFLLSGVGWLTLAPGDGWGLAAAVLWALHVICIGWLAQRTNALRLALVQYLVCGLLSMVLGYGRGRATLLQGLAVVWWAVLYTGVLSIGLGFTLQVVGQRGAPATDAAVILSTESVFAVLFGWLLLGETLTGRQLLGCGLMLAGMLLTQAFSSTSFSS